MHSKISNEIFLKMFLAFPFSSLSSFIEESKEQQSGKDRNLTKKREVNSDREIDLICLMMGDKSSYKRTDRSI